MFFRGRFQPLVPLKLTSHGILHYLWSAGLSKKLSQLIMSIFIFSQYFFQLFLHRFFSTETCGVTPHCLYRDSLTLSPLILLCSDLPWNSVICDISFPRKQYCDMNLKWLYLKVYHYSKYS